MKRGVALRRRIRIDTAIEQPRRQLVVRVGGGKQERIEADFRRGRAAGPAAWPAAASHRQ